MPSPPQYWGTVDQLGSIFRQKWVNRRQTGNIFKILWFPWLDVNHTPIKPGRKLEKKSRGSFATYI